MVNRDDVTLDTVMVYCEYCGGAFESGSVKCENCGAPRTRCSRVDTPAAPGMLATLHQLNKRNPKVFRLGHAMWKAYYRELLEQHRFVNCLMELPEWNGYRILEFCGKPVILDENEHPNFIGAA